MQSEVGINYLIIDLESRIQRSLLFALERGNALFRAAIILCRYEVSVRSSTTRTLPSWNLSRRCET